MCLARSQLLSDVKINTMHTKRVIGFTLVEMLVVVALIGLLAAVVLASLDDGREQAKIATAQAQLHEIWNAMAMLNFDTGQHPSTIVSWRNINICDVSVAPGNEIDLSSATAGLIANDPVHPYPDWDGPYISTAIDPWGSPYIIDTDYACSANTPGCQGITATVKALVSCGPDADFQSDPFTNGCANAQFGGNNNYDDIVLLICR